jgi:hypothetical protein
MHRGSFVTTVVVRQSAWHSSKAQHVMAVEGERQRALSWKPVRARPNAMIDNDAVRDDQREIDMIEKRTGRQSCQDYGPNGECQRH